MRSILKLVDPHDSGRGAGRLMIALFIIFAMLVIVLPASPFATASVQAQQSGSPTPSGSASRSASPTPSASPKPTGPAIQFVNPSGYAPAAGAIISGKNDGINTTYHLVAWTRAAPSDAIVEFKYQGSSNDISIGNATRHGDDTWDLEWDVSAVPADGTYTLKAIMFSGGVELARDEEEVYVNNRDDILDLEDPQAETVEMTYPTIAGPFGLYQAPGGRAVGIIDVSSSGANPPPSGSTGTTFIQALYTMTDPGTEPVWKGCGSESKTSSADGVRCTLAQGDSATAVTAIASVANNSPNQVGFQAGLNQSGDAHRVLSYAQVPSGITLNPGSQSTKNAAQCSEVITATVLDQVNRRMATVNADVHVSGPSDDLQFDGPSGSNTSASQAPDKAHVAPENAASCESGGNNGTQGEHEKAPPEIDIKHIESTTGTNDAGVFKFQLFSPQAGTANIAVFADADNDDQWCSGEASGTGTATWNPAGTSPAPTPTPTPTPTSTLGPDLAVCPSPTPSGSSTGGGNTRTITLSASSNRVRSGAQVSLSGQIESGDSTCSDGQIVDIERRVHGTSTFKDFRTTATDPDGYFTTTITATRSADYDAVAPPNGTCAEATSSVETVVVKVKVALRASDTSAARGSTVRLTGKVAPNHKGDKVTLQRKKGTKWVKVKVDRLTKRSRYAFAVVADWAGKRWFRVVWPKQDLDHIRGVSKIVKIAAT